MSNQDLDSEARLAETSKEQSKASNPANSVFVSANAGTGKTHILVNRVLRLLLDGSEPFRILCLTYTNAAAAEMENRLFSVLSKWVTMQEQALAKTLIDLLGRPLKEGEIETARRLFAKAIETPGGMKVQTIHSFCEKLLQRFPLEADVPPHFKVLDEPTASEILNNSMSQVLKKALKDKSSAEAKALQNVIAHATDTQFETLVLGTLRQKTNMAPYLGGDQTKLTDALATILQLPKNQDQNHWQQIMASAIADDLSGALIPLLQQTGKSTDATMANHLSAIKTASTPSQRISISKQAFLTGGNDKRKRLVTKAVSDAEPALADRLTGAQDKFHEAFVADESLAVAIATKNLTLLADKIIQIYEQQKIARAALDYQDLIERTAELLTSPQTTAWVLYKLDQGIDHILVDEAQDTSPDQWQIIGRLAEEFFSGIGADEKHRTLFAVGDEKQSIYGFQGADPRQFSDMARHFKQGAESSGKEFEEIPLNLSFRSTAAVLEAVDHIFENPEYGTSLTMSGKQITHYANRYDSPGLVEIWPTEQTQKTDKAIPFAPLDEAAPQNAGERLARKIAKQIRNWLDSGEMLESQGRPIKPGDVLILVRKRAPFAPMIIRALKALNIPVAGADRIVITEQLAVMDMMALGQFLTLPEDDLSLACLLKSPIFNLSEEDLFQLSNNRKGSLWQSLRYFAKREQKFQAIASQLSTWLSRADILPPFEFFANLLEGEGLRKKFIARLGAVAGDALDEFLNLSLRYDDQEPPSLEGFLTWLRRSGAEVKRDMDKGRDEVRVMTVHGAKGLEAQIVILPDTCSTGSASQSDSLITIEDPSHPQVGEGGKPLIWSLAGKSHLPALSEGRQKIKQSETREQMRLLYVALTRARDRLYITGFESATGRGKNCWYDIIDEGLSPHTVEVETVELGIVKQLKTGTASTDKLPEQDNAKSSALPPLPAWANELAKSEPTRTIPVSPSSVIPYEAPEDDEDKLPVEPALMSPRNLGSDGRFVRGRLVHKLLEFLPDVSMDERQKAAQTLADAHGRALTPSARTAIINETMAILNNPAYADLFQQGSEAEVSLIAKISPKGSSKPPILLSGQIDRLVVRDQEIVIVDYKSNRPSPRNLEDVAEAYLAQLAAYRIALREIYPDHKLKSSLLWTDGPFLMDIPPSMLDKYEAILNKQ